MRTWCGGQASWKCPAATGSFPGASRPGPLPWTTTSTRFASPWNVVGRRGDSRCLFPVAVTRGTSSSSSTSRAIGRSSSSRVDAFPPERTIDERVAADVAQRLGIRHEIVGPPEREVPSYVAANVMTNLTAPRRGWKLSVVRKLWESVTTSYDGIGGDMLSGGSAISRKALELLDKGRYEEYCRTTFMNKMTDKVVPRSQLEKMSDEVVIEHMLPELELHLGATNPATSFHFWNRTRRFDSTNPFGMLRGLPTVHVPFLDLDLFEFLAGLPARVQPRWVAA